MYPIKNAEHSFESHTAIYEKILESWGIDIRTVSNISICEGNLVFVRDGAQESCPACNFHTYKSIVKNTPDEPWNIGGRVKSVFWKNVAHRETKIVLDAVSKRSEQTIRTLESNEERIRELEYIRYLLGIPDIDVMKEIVLPYEIRVRAKK